jgi:mono/diheme cytochrome c family protein
MRGKIDPGVQGSNSVLMAVLYRTAILLLLLLPANAIKSQDWVAPADASKIANPVAADATAIATGKALFTTICFVCHGDEGKGDGINAPSLERQPADLSSADVQKQTDGALFWKISEGNPPMLTFKDVLSEEQRWQLVHFLRTLAADRPAVTKSDAIASAEEVEVPVINLYEGQTEGKELYRNICGACHTIGKGKLIGPDLKGATDRHDRPWLHNWIRSSTAMIESGDPDAVALFAENNNVLMPDQPYLDESQVDALLDYIAEKSVQLSAATVSSATSGTAVAVRAPRQPVGELENVLGKTLMVAIFFILFYVISLLGRTYQVLVRGILNK